MECPKCGVKAELPPPPEIPAVADSYSSAEFDTAPPRICPICGDRLSRNDVSCAFCESLRRRQRKKLIRTIVGSVLSLLAIGAALSMVRWQPRKPVVVPAPPDGTWLPQPRVQTPKSPDDFKVGRFSLTPAPGRTEAIVTGDIENVSENLYLRVKITLDLLDAQGKKIGTVDSFINELPARSIWHVIARTSVTNATNAWLSSIKETP